MGKSAGSQPKGTHGFYLPTIKIWNMFADTISRGMDPAYILRGSIEDLVLGRGTGNCWHCPEELIRQQVQHNNYFAGGIIYCPEAKNGKDHPKEYWIEVWPDKPAILKRGQLPLDQHELSQNLVEMFELSHPIIKPCYSEAAILAHRFIGAFKMESDPAYRHPPLPRTPTFIHR